jgi:acetylglutamate kinase
MTPTLKARILAEALPYIRAYHGKVLVIRFGGAAMADPELKAGFARDVALLHLVGMQPIVVHGGGWQIDRLLMQMGTPAHTYAGIRITDERTLNVVEMVLGELNQELTGMLNRHGSRAVGLDGQDGRFIRAVKMALPPDPGGEAPPDPGFVGDVEAVDLGLVRLLLSRNFVPVIMPIGVGDDGTAYHIDSDRLAARLARELEAEKLIMMTNVPGIPGPDGRLAYILRAGDTEGLLRRGVIDAKLAPRVRAALDAIGDGVRSVHIIDGGVAHALLLEVLTAEGVGTAVRSDAGAHFLEDSRSYLLDA